MLLQTHKEERIKGHGLSGFHGTDPMGGEDEDSYRKPVRLHKDLWNSQPDVDGNSQKPPNCFYSAFFNIRLRFLYENAGISGLTIIDGLITYYRETFE